MKRIFLIIALTGLQASAQMSVSEVDALVSKTMQAFDVPGIAVAIVKDGKVVLSKGYGVRSILSREKVDGNSLFGIASNSKAFTTAGLAMLVDEGKISWDDKVIKYIPDFKMYNDYVTSEFTVRDLLTHRSGLGLGAGDLMIWPDRNNFTTSDIIRNLRFLKPVSAFRTKYDYDNLLYIVAGEVLHQASGMTWQDFVETRILKPLQMSNSAAAFTRLKDTANVVTPHVPTDGKLKAISRYKGTAFDAAAGIYSSVNDLSKWVIAQLDNGKYAGGELFSEAQQKEMWTPQTLLPNPPNPPYNSLFKAYGLGWQLMDIKGYKQVSHTGGLDGMVTQVVLIPEMKLGIIVLTNQQSGTAFNVISNTIKDSYLHLAKTDHLALLGQQRKQKEDDADKVTDEVTATLAENKRNKISVNLKSFSGTFSDHWFGKISLTESKGGFWFQSERSPQLRGEVFFYRDETFVVKWDNRSFLADAFLSFSDSNGHITMKPVSPLTDFSYDFQDLDFLRVDTAR